MSDDQVDEAIEDFEERAAIIEYEAGLKRYAAESLALREIAETMGKPAAKEVQQWRQKKAV